MNIPCRVMSELAAHEYEQRQGSDSFDEFDEMKVGAVVPYELVKPVMELLAWRKVAHLPTELQKDLDNLYKACRERYADL